MTKEEFWSILRSAPEPEPVIYRLYHDAAGYPLFYSMEDVPGTYIDIDPETYRLNASNIRVRNGQIVPVTWQTASKLTPSNTGTVCYNNDVSIVVSTAGQHWTKKIYETN